MSDDLLDSGVQALRDGKKREARWIFGEVVREDPDNAAGWWYLAGVLDDPEQKASCLRQVLRLEPDHEEARSMLAKVQRRVSRPTPAQGTPRPVYDVQQLGDAVVPNSPSAVSDDASEPLSKDLTVMVISTVIALLAIVGAVIVISQGLIPASVHLRLPGETPTLRPLTFDVQACTVTGGTQSVLVFINNTDVTLDLLEGTEGTEALVLTLSPGAQGSVPARVGTIRYVARAQEDGFAPSGAFFEVPAGQSCRVPIR